MIQEFLKQNKTALLYFYLDCKIETIRSAKVHDMYHMRGIQGADSRNTKGFQFTGS